MTESNDMKNEKEMLQMDKVIESLCLAHIVKYLDSEHGKMAIEIAERFSELYSPNPIEANEVVEYLHKKHFGEQIA